MHGLHLTADLHGCPPDLPVMTEPAALQALCEAAVAESGLSAVARLFHRFEPHPATGGGAPAGITGVVLLAESHVAVHTWPEQGGVTLDVHVCHLGRDNRAAAQALMARLSAAFHPTRAHHQSLQRGLDLPQGTRASDAAP
jgi:S-adenosylmethionine decarboxylase proenzyme